MSTTNDPEPAMPPHEHSVGIIAVLIIDDHRVFGDSLARLLSDEDDIKVVGVAANAADGLILALSVRPDVVLVDYQMPDGNGTTILAEVRRRLPDAHVVMLTGGVDDRVLLEAIEAGCSGFLTKDHAASEVADAVRMAAAGEALISPRELARLLPKLNRNYHAIGSDLTDRERQILGLLAEGLANTAIAAQLYLSVNTVRNYVQGVLTKLGAHSKLEAVAIGVNERIVNYPTSD